MTKREVEWPAFKAKAEELIKRYALRNGKVDAHDFTVGYAHWCRQADPEGLLDAERAGYEWGKWCHAAEPDVEQGEGDEREAELVLQYAPPADRLTNLDRVRESLRAGGARMLWKHPVKGRRNTTIEQWWHGRGNVMILEFGEDGFDVYVEPTGSNKVLGTVDAIRAHCRER